MRSKSRFTTLVLLEIRESYLQIALYASRPLSPGATQHSLPSGRYPSGRVPHRQRSGRPCRNEKPFGTKFLATASALLSEVSSAIFWDSMRYPLGSSPSARKHNPSFRRPFPSTSQTFVIAPA